MRGCSDIFHPFRVNSIVKSDLLVPVYAARAAFFPIRPWQRRVRFPPRRRGTQTGRLPTRKLPSLTWILVAKVK